MSSSVTTLASLWAETVARHDDRQFLEWRADVDQRVDVASVQWTYREFDDLIASVAGGLHERGIGAGGRIHVVLDNGPAFVAVWLAAIRLGAVIVPADPRSPSFELARQRDAIRPDLAVVGLERCAAYVEQAAAGGPMTVVLPDADLDALRGRALPATPIDQCAPAGLLFTSGTTSAPKAVIVTQANYAFAGETMAHAAGVTSDSRLIVCLPLFHANAQYYSFAAAIARGAAVVLLPRFSASTFIASARESRATHGSLFAAPVRMILARRPGGEAPAELEHCWYAQNLRDDEYESFAQLVGCRPRQLYGMTETIAAVLSNPVDRPRPGSMGKVTEGCDVELRVAGGRIAEVGEEGEVHVRGVRGLTIFDGYLNNPGATAVALSDDGVIATGDFACRDAEGYHYFAGRRSDVLKVGGENVSTTEVEAILAEHPDVAEVAVVGRPDHMLGEVPIAFLVLRASGPGSLDRFAEWSSERLAPSKRPRDYRIVDELPRTSVGKIRKIQLRDDV